MTRTANTLGFLATVLLFLGMFAGLFGGALSLSNTAPERECGICGQTYSGKLCPYCAYSKE